MHLVLFRDWIRRIYATQDNEIDCDRVFEQIARYVDMKTAGEEPAEDFPELLEHLEQCPHCCDIYLALQEAALLESQELAPELVPLEPRQSR